jgi:hypothetical protein
MPSAPLGLPAPKLEPTRYGSPINGDIYFCEAHQVAFDGAAKLIDGRCPLCVARTDMGAFLKIVKPRPTESQKLATRKFLEKIAVHQIRRFGLSDTPAEYIAKCQAREASK